jgi:hypothetical protein
MGTLHNKAADNVFLPGLHDITSRKILNLFLIAVVVI